MKYSPIIRQILLDLTANRVYLQPGEKPPKGARLHRGIRKSTARWYDATNRPLTAIDSILNNKRGRKALHDVVVDTLNNAERPHLDNPLSTYLADALGYHSPPKTMDDAEFQKIISSDANIPLIYRGVGGNSIEGFIEGSNKIQRCGAYGAGLYTAICAVKNIHDHNSFGLPKNTPQSVLKELRGYAKDRDGAVLYIRQIEEKLQEYAARKEFLNHFIVNSSNYSSADEYGDIIDSIVKKYPLVKSESLQSRVNTYYSRISEGESMEAIIKEATNSKEVCDWELSDEENNLEREQMDFNEADEYLNSLIIENGGEPINIGMKTFEEAGINKVSKRYPAGAYDIAYNYPKQGVGKILQMTLDPSIKIANHADIWETQLDLSKYKFDRETEHYLKKAANMDNGLKAILLGYDAMRIKMETTNAQAADYILIFNRGKVILSNKIIDKEEI